MNNNQEIIVYLVDYKSVGDNCYDNVVFDFRKLRDWEQFCNAIQIERGENSLMSISSFRSPKRLRRGCYYKFRVDKFIRLQPLREYIQDSALFAYNFILNDKKRIQSVMLFDEHALLNSKDTYAKVTGLSRAKMPLAITDGTLRVNDVGQGNHNEILNQGKVTLVYDMGAPLQSSLSYVRQLIDGRIEKYKKDKPVLIISHWDYDHILQLKHLTDQELACFSHVYCSQKIKSVTAKLIMKRINEKLPKHTVHVLANRIRKGQDYPLMRKEMEENGFSLYVGEENRNINYCGLVLFVHGAVGNALLTGDCALVQASDVLNNEADKLTALNNKHKLVVPHHGGDYTYKKDLYRIYDVPNNVDCDVAIYSVGRGNVYGHPEKDVVDLLDIKFSRDRRTDFEAISISENI